MVGGGGGGRRGKTTGKGRQPSMKRLTWTQPYGVPSLGFPGNKLQAHCYLLYSFIIINRANITLTLDLQCFAPLSACRMQICVWQAKRTD